MKLHGLLTSLQTSIHLGQNFRLNKLITDGDLERVTGMEQLESFSSFPLLSFADKDHSPPSSCFYPHCRICVQEMALRQSCRIWLHWYKIVPPTLATTIHCIFTYLDIPLSVSLTPKKQYIGLQKHSSVLLMFT